MIRGVNKHIIEVSETENEYFERAILLCGRICCI